MTVTIDPKALPNRDLKNYYDAEPVHALFGDDAHERMMEETEGDGYVTRRGSRLYHRSRTGEVQELPPDRALTGPEEDG